MIARYAIPFALIMGLVIFPLLAYGLCRWLLPRRYGHRVGLCSAFAVVALALYGHLVGFERFEVRQVEYVNSDLPTAFDGYRIVLFSDAHVGTMSGRRQWMMQRAVDSIMAQHPDMIVFVGDLQNIEPSDIRPHLGVLSQLKAPDGVYSVLGNHDYDRYQNCDSVQKAANCRETQRLERQAGWDLLMNEHRILRRGADSIVLGGMENWGDVERMPRLGDVGKTLNGVQPSAFVVMLQHDPSAWRAKILPECNAQLTLSGHTHGMQFGLFGWSPMSLARKEWGGTVYEGARAIHVTTGLGGLIPFRLGMPGEIVVITLRKKSSNL